MDICEWSYGTCNDTFHCYNGQISNNVPCTQEDKMVCPIWLVRNNLPLSQVEVKEEIVDNSADLQQVQETVKPARKSKSLS